MRAAHARCSDGKNISSSGSAANPFKWNGGSGYYSDAESGLQKIGARYYDPSVGSWISQDTMLIAGSPADSQAVNRYLYCGANPVGSIDPSGNVPWGKLLQAFVRALVLGSVGIDITGPASQSSGGSGAGGGFVNSDNGNGNNCDFGDGSGNGNSGDRSGNSGNGNGNNGNNNGNNNGSTTTQTAVSGYRNTTFVKVTNITNYYYYTRR